MSALAPATKRGRPKGETPKVLTSDDQNCPTGIEGFYTTSIREPGRPRNPGPVSSEALSLKTLGEIDYSRGRRACRAGRRLLALELVALVGYEAAAKHLNLSQALLRELTTEQLIIECMALDPTWRPRCNFRTVPTYRKRFTRAQRIAERARFREKSPERHAIGACSLCVDFYRKQANRLHISRCPHYDTTFEYDSQNIPRRLPHNCAQFRAEILEAAPKTGPALPAWNQGIRSGRRKDSYATKTARHLYRRGAGETMEGKFGDIMTTVNGDQSLKSDYRKAMEYGA